MNNMNTKNQIENSHYLIEFKDGQIHLFDKVNQANYPNIISVIDDGDEGDSYDYSEPFDNKEMAAEFLGCEIVENALQSTMKLTGTIALTIDLESRANDGETVQQEVNLEIVLNHHILEESISVDIRTVNIADEHRLRLVFNTHKKNEKSYADIQFGTIERPTYLPQVEQWKEERWDEKPRTIEPLQSYVTNGFDACDLQIVTEAVREYQFIGEDYAQIAMTVYRSVPYLGKSDLQDRPGRESGTKVRTEGTRHMNELIQARYYLRVLGNEDDEYSCAQFAKEMLTPLIGYQAASFRNNTDEFVLSIADEMNLPPTHSLVEVEGKVVCSTVKKDSRGTIIRLYNPKRSERAEASVDNKTVELKTCQFDDLLID